jgi:TIR domain
MAAVFISHSVRDDPRAADVLKSVQQGLKERGHDVWVDLEILQPGQEWEAELYRRLGRCRAAVILLSPKAIASKWVKREVNILLWRYSLNAPVYIVPALIEDVTPQSAELAEDFGELTRHQFAWSSAGDDAEVSRKVVARFAALPPVEDSSPFCRWVSNISAYISEVKDRSALAAAAHEFDMNADEVKQVDDHVEGPLFLAHQFLSPRRLAARSSGEDPYQAVFDAVFALSHHVRELRELVTLIAPTWVDADSARRLVSLSPQRRPTVVVLDAYDTSTAINYIDRAYCCGGRHQVGTFVVRTGEWFDQEAERQCDNAVRKLFTISPRAPLKKTLEQRLQERGSPGGDCFLVVDPDVRFDDDAVDEQQILDRVAHAAAAVHAIRSRYEWLTIVLLTAHTQPSRADLAAWDLADAVILELDASDEDRGYEMVNLLENLPSRLIGAPR